MKKNTSSGTRNRGHRKYKGYMGGEVLNQVAIWGLVLVFWRWKWGRIQTRGGKSFALFRMEGRGNKEEREFKFVQNMECRPLRDSGHNVLRCVSLPWSTDDKIDHTWAKTSSISWEDSLTAKEWSGVERFWSNKGTIQVLREMFPVLSLSFGVVWPFRCFYMNSF